MMKLKILKNTLIILVGVVFGHYVTKGWQALESYVLSHSIRAANAVMVSAAGTLGLEPRKNAVKEIHWRDYASLRAAEEDVPPIIIRAMMKVENADRAYGVSVKGAIGPLQLLPDKAKWCGLEHIGKLYDEKTNVDCGVKYFKQLLNDNIKRKSKHVVRDSLREYNGGYKCINGGCSESEGYWQSVLVAVSLDRAVS